MEVVWWVMKNMSTNSEVPNPSVWYPNQLPTTSTKSEQVRKSKVLFVANPFAQQTALFWPARQGGGT